MATDLVKKLRSMIANVEEALSYFQPLQHKGELYGDRKYTPESLKMALRILLNEFSDLIETKFFEGLPIGERNEITKLLASLLVSTHRREYNQTAVHADELKMLVRDYQAKMLTESRRLLETVAEWQQRSSELKSLIETARDKSQEIFTDAAEHEEALRRITERYEGKLNKYTSEQDKAKEEAKALIADVKGALEPATVAGLSAAFTERYNTNKVWWKVGRNFFWLLAAAVSIGGALWAIYTLLSGESLKVGDYIARILIMPPAILAAWFCATRYVRYTNITEDYGYKSVLAKSMVAFLDQFQDRSEERELYLKTVLTQLFQDPLRKRHDMEHPAAGFLRRNKRTEKGDEGEK